MGARFSRLKGNELMYKGKECIRNEGDREELNIFSTSEKITFYRDG